MLAVRFYSKWKLKCKKKWKWVPNLIIEIKYMSKPKQPKVELWKEEGGSWNTLVLKKMKRKKEFRDINVWSLVFTCVRSACLRLHVLCVVQKGIPFHNFLRTLPIVLLLHTSLCNYNSVIHTHFILHLPLFFLFEFLFLQLFI